MDLMTLSCIAAFAPLVGAILAGFLGWKLGRAFSHTVTILSVAISFAASVAALMQVSDGARLDAEVYTWLAGEGFRIQVGFLVDKLTVTMMCVVTFVSLMVHIYTIGYMADDPGYQRFFAYISLFTFSMMMLVMANNFLQLFFGWEAVGLVSYLLIGFWFTRPTAIYANLKAFLVNRVGDFGFLLGVGLVFAVFGTLDYGPVFAEAPKLARAMVEVIPGQSWSLITMICICLFIGAMGKSAQFPLHVWLPDSMEGPTPISALIHAATMVTAGIFMVARMSPLFELSQAALSFVIVIGAITMFFMALIALVQYDIKRVVAYSTLSQLGYMTVALGAGAYSVGDLPPDDARLLQGGALPRRGLGDHRAAPRAGHAQDGRAAQVHADHLLDGADRRARQRGHSAVRGVLLQGDDRRGGAPVDDAGRQVRVRAGGGGRVRERRLLVPARVLRVPRQGALREPSHEDTATSITAAARVAVGGDAAADPARDPVDLHRRDHHRQRWSTAPGSAAPSRRAR